ncbi:aminotransferase class I/II-fold pyridoxal phosphate-dependent enzyme [Seonamhaeicola marinus]|uniref:Pyridoxal phosphate-dependent aminotransferase family protein n=1 Tax=Seonamhaeicola marinus TaxID=1912246 RepID=A0A5D0HRL5_9FLAO|nr:pyridoxal phosphate-dependent aminotransferase family protein [Seonamhaeicola marinus]TYA73928.1 pyridoxal phosphate-dependent aminotransferase family protein [Seonamhaeicola marinus]
MFPKKLLHKLDQRKAVNALRTLKNQTSLIDLSSNDYLGFSKNKDIFEDAHLYLTRNSYLENGATGSRLLSGNHKLYGTLEDALQSFHNAKAALVFNSGYDANVGFFSSVPQRGDIILYDEYSHASIRDGIQMSNAKAYKFKHNNLEDLEEKIRRLASNDQDIFVVTESVFSMDGDSPDLKLLSDVCKTNKAYLIVDEAHSVGVFGNSGEGLIQELNIEDLVFARIITFGKAMGCHGAAILGSEKLKQYLVNFCRSFIYTTALSPHALSTILSSYKELMISSNVTALRENILRFKKEVGVQKLRPLFIESNSAIHCCVIPGNTNVKTIAEKLEEKGFDVKPILSPTVPNGEERLRFCLHAYNSEKEISEVLALLTTFVS